MVVPASVSKGILMGLAMAFAQSVASTAALRWAWKKNFFYWIWAGGMVLRAVVFAATAIIVYRSPGLSFVATLGTLVLATTIFLVVESAIFLKPKRT